jgi:hypothetical protein
VGFVVFHLVGRRSSMATVTIFDDTGIIFINVWSFEVSSLITREIFWLTLYICGLARVINCTGSQLHGVLVKVRGDIN